MKPYKGIQITQRKNEALMSKGSGKWIVMHVLDAFRDANGKPGEHKIPLKGYDTPMTKEEALKALEEVEKARPNEDFSIRQIGEVFPMKREP
jgi:hypothetical protein